ncbi:MAG: CusA/CzcA family heavy metal efflux RND transporter, partial [Thermoanaerobaculia bacterium]
MIKKIIEFSAKNKIFVLLLVISLCVYAYYILKQIRLDALPDLSDTQVIVFVKWDRPPDVIEDQVTYPIISSLLGAPKVKSIRGFTDFGFSFIYTIFEDGTDIYWARSRVLEYLSKIEGNLPEGVKIEIGPDATGVGWIFQYALVDKSGKIPLDRLRSLQDWNLKYALQSVEGVSEVASIGGYQKQYQISVDPNKLSSYNIGVKDIISAIKNSNNEVGGRLIEFSGFEYMVRGRGYLKNIREIENIVLKVTEKGVPILIKDIANVQEGPEIRRGVSDLDGLGEAVGGIVVARHGENALNVIKRVKERIKEIEPSLPEGVKIITTYDRSSLIEKAIDTLKHELKIEMIIVSIVILIFLWHIPSSIVPILTIPISVLLAFIPLYFMGITVNIMSLAGIAISIGVLVDGAIVEVENAYNKIRRWIEGGKVGDFHKIRLEALQEVGPSVFFSLLVIAVSFIPIFALVEQEGRLFKPLAWSKNLTMLMASILAITLDPAMRMLFARVEPYNFKPKILSSFASTIFVGKYISEEKHPISKILFKIYEPVCRFTLRHPKKIIFFAISLFFFSLIFYFKLGREFMPPLKEGSLLYMPTTLPGISITEVKRVLQEQDRILKEIPEVERVFGKAGRALSSTDPAPLSMIETTIILKEEKFWREKKRWYSNWAPEILKKFLRPIWPDKISYEELIKEMDEKMKFLGITNAWTMPIKGRIDMLTTGIRTPIGIKIFGSDLKEIERIGIEIEDILKDLKGTRSVFAERVSGGYYIDIIPEREKLARYGLTVDDLHLEILYSIGGENITYTIEGRERYPVNLRYPRQLRENIDKLKKVLIKTPQGFFIP